MDTTTPATDNSQDTAADPASHDKWGDEAYVPPPQDWAGDLMDHEAVAHSGLISAADY